MTMSNNKDKEEHEEHAITNEECCHTIAKPTITIITSLQTTQENSSLPRITNMNETTSMNTSNNKDEDKSTIDLLNLSPKFHPNFPLRLPSFDA